jgi:hypothetical protein
MMLKDRLWTSNGPNSVTKLSDPTLLSPPERDALLRMDTAARQCQEITINFHQQYAAWRLPAIQAYFATVRDIGMKLAAGQITVGVANQYYAQSEQRFENDTAKAKQVAEQQDREQAEAALASLTDALNSANQAYVNARAQSYHPPTVCHTVDNPIGSTTTCD